MISVKFLIIEDNGADYELLVRSIQKYDIKTDFVRAQDAQEMRKALFDHKFDVVVSDYMLPRFTGLDALRLFKSFKLNIPFITLTGTGAEEIAVDMMREGADDYVIKSHVERLYHSVINLLQKYETIRQKVKLDKAIKESEKAYRLLAEHSSDLISRHSLTGKFIYASPAIFIITGYRPDEVKGKLLRDFLHADDIVKIRTQVNAIILENNTSIFEYRFKRKDGEYIWIETSGKIIYDEYNNPIEIVSVTRDATDRILKDQRIKESEEQYRLIAENATDMITRHDLLGFYNYVSTSSYTLLGYAPADLLGKNAYDFLHPDDLEKVKSGLNEFLKMGLGIHTTSYRYKKKDGKYVWIESTNKLTFKENTGEIEGVISISRDITERKLFESKLEEKIKELDTFIYRSSHDLKGPLASLQGLINVAKSEVQDIKANEYIGLIERSVNHLDNILMDLLNITRITQGSITYSKLNLATLISDTISSFENLVEYKKIEWLLDIDESILLVTDKSLINNVLHNVIINAIKYHDRKKPNSFVKIVAHAYNHNVELIIEDNGEGIPEELQKNIFDMFFRGNTKSSGTGLGLYIVKNAVEKLGGQIELNSKENKGSKFTITLPLNLEIVQSNELKMLN
jgi:PAS domain S-box-containing protein